MKKIIVESCKECPFRDLLFSTDGNAYCNKLSKLAMKETLYSRIPYLERQVNVPEEGILDNCPLPSTE